MQTQTDRTEQDRYIAIPYSLLRTPGIPIGAATLFGYIDSFGEEGCSQTNAELARVLQVTPRTISRWVARLRDFGLIRTRQATGYGRTVWAQ